MGVVSSCSRSLSSTVGKKIGIYVRSSGVLGGLHRLSELVSIWLKWKPLCSMTKGGDGLEKPQPFF